MNIRPTPEFEPAVEENEALHEWLAREAAIEFAQLQAGETVRITSEEAFLNLVRQSA